MRRNPSSPRSDANAPRSFFSGHIANTVATSVAALGTYQRLAPTSVSGDL